MISPTPPPALLGHVASMVLVLLALPLSGCFDFESSSCPDGLLCPRGMQCAAAENVCIKIATLSSSSCGDGVQQSDEACDDGNLKSGDGCNSTCASNEKCGNGVTDPDESCDDGNRVDGDTCSSDCRHSAACGNNILDEKEECDPPGDRPGAGFTCDSSCHIAFCGNGKQDDGEECDDGNRNDQDSCLSTCKMNRCGDSHLDSATEVCDDGNRVTETVCPYGLQTCTVCRADCQEGLQVGGPYCGDGKTDPLEACDNGPANGKKLCPYGSKTCDVCNSSCTGHEKGKGASCGDSIVNDTSEACDFGRGCGTCSSDCRRIKIDDKTHAKGNITILDLVSIPLGEVIVINDGSNLPVTFQLNWQCHSTHRCSEDEHHLRQCCIPVNNIGNRSQLASAIADSINSVNPKTENHWLDISAEAQSDTVVLTHASPGASGNQSILTPAPPKGLTVEGMSGGLGFDCPAGSPCIEDPTQPNGGPDCARGLKCSHNLCVKQ